MKKTKKILSFILPQGTLSRFAIHLVIFILSAQVALAEFNPNYIISDEEILDYNSMSKSEITAFLDARDGFLATYSTTNPDGKRMMASEIIYDRAQSNKISPKFIIVLLQKEQSLIESKSPRQSQLDWATGYGCPDGDSCNTRWKGLWKQINSATLQFKDYIDNPHLYSFKAGHTYTFSNPYSTLKQGDDVVTIMNKATAALYNYTPHVYNGNYNFHKIWQRYFTRTYPNGTLLQAKGEVGVWLLQDGKKRPFLSRGALVSRYDINKIISVKKSELDKYPTGRGIKFAQYSLIRSPRGTIFLIVDSKKRGISSSEAFRSIGFNPEEIIDASWDDINAYEDGAIITATSTYPTGALLQNKTTGGIYYVSEGEKAPLLDAVFLKTKFKKQSIIPIEPEKLDNYKTIAPYKFSDGELLSPDASPAVYIIAEGKKRPIVSGEAFVNMGYKWENILSVPQRIIDLYEYGDPITDEFLDIYDNLDVSSSTPASLASSTEDVL